MVGLSFKTCWRRPRLALEATMDEFCHFMDCFLICNSESEMAENRDFQRVAIGLRVSDFGRESTSWCRWTRICDLFCLPIISSLGMKAKRLKFGHTHQNRNRQSSLQPKNRSNDVFGSSLIEKSDFRWNGVFFVTQKKCIFGWILPKFRADFPAFVSFFALQRLWFDVFLARTCLKKSTWPFDAVSTRLHKVWPYSNIKHD